MHEWLRGSHIDADSIELELRELLKQAAMLVHAPRTGIHWTPIAEVPFTLAMLWLQHDIDPIQLEL